MAGLAADKTLADVTTGIVAGTKVATQMGWRAVEAVAEGDLVLTFDGGLQPVIAVTREVIFANDQADYDLWPLHVPAGALGNREAMRLLPGQSILIESDAAEEALGDPFALIPARALDGYRCIVAPRPEARIEIIHLHFAQDEIVFANMGALFLCPRATDILSDMAAEASTYKVLSDAQADMLVSFLEIEDEQHGYRPCTARADSVAA